MGRTILELAGPPLSAISGTIHRFDTSAILPGDMSTRRTRIVQRSDLVRIRRTPSNTQNKEYARDAKVGKLVHEHPEGNGRRLLYDWISRVDDRFFGSPRDISPHEAILKAIAITHGEVLYCDAQIGRLSEDELFERPLQTTVADMPDGSTTLITERRDAETVSRWVTFRQSAIERLARYSKMALDIGIEERQLMLAEREADMMSTYFESVLRDLELSPQQRKALGPAMRKHFGIIEAQIKGET